MTEEHFSKELLDKATADLEAQLQAFIAEEDLAKAEKRATLLGRSVIDWERQCDFNADFLPKVAEKIQSSLPKDAPDALTMLSSMKNIFATLLGRIIATKHPRPMHEILTDEELDLMEKDGFFQMQAMARMEDMLEEEEEEEEEEEGDCSEAGCCADDEE